LKRLTLCRFIASYAKHRSIKHTAVMVQTSKKITANNYKVPASAVLELMISAFSSCVPELEEILSSGFLNMYL
jgi:hypothetical protein